MDIGIDSQGRKIHYKDALIGSRYFCPYCTEKLVPRKGKKACFAHNAIKGRTPLQRTCPEYHENTSYIKIDNESDIIYINNGGIPLYLSNDGDKFELRAYFPSISEVCRNKLIDCKAEVIINNKKWCYVENLNYYIVHYIQEWINVKLNPNIDSNEINRKWLWGIRGINVENDIYHSKSEGGYRVAIKANIYVGKKYIKMFYNTIPEVYGITFKNIGKIQLDEGAKRKFFDIYEMEIIKFTEEARQFIEGKGYNFVEKVNKVIPLWPPAVFKGNELIFDKDKAWFYHFAKENNEYLNEIQDGKLDRLTGNKLFKISNIATSSEKAIISTNKLICGQEIAGTRTEIKYILNYKTKLNDRELLEPKIVLRDIEGKIIEHNGRNNTIPKDGRVLIEANIPVMATVLRDSYCRHSSKYGLDKITYGLAVHINCKGFGNVLYEYDKARVGSKKINKVDWKALYVNLYRCKGESIVPTYRNKLLLYKIKQNINKENIHIYEIIYKWIQLGKVPIGAQVFLYKIEEELCND